jgi:hypothetical protein
VRPQMSASKKANEQRKRQKREAKQRKRASRKVSASVHMVR